MIINLQHEIGWAEDQNTALKFYFGACMFSFSMVVLTKYSGSRVNFKLTFYSGLLEGEILVSKIYMIVLDVNKKGEVD